MSQRAFHFSSRQEEEAKAEAAVVEEKSGYHPVLFGLPVAIFLGVPAVYYEWLVFDEEMQLAGCFVAFCAVAYTQGGQAMHDSIKEAGDAILKEHNDIEDKVIGALEAQLTAFKEQGSFVKDVEEVSKTREQAYAKLNAAGKIKPLHDFKGQMERVLGMIAQEEQNVAEKAKAALMAEATAYVAEEFASSKELKKAALDSAIAKIKGTAKPGDDPVQATFIKFFKAKAAAAKKSDDGSEAAAQKSAMIEKLNAVAKNEGFFFQFDPSGQPKLVV